jgi:putative Holliday junction resolvase
VSRLLGIDPGDQRVGLAVSDEEGRIAFPFAIIERRGRGLDWTARQIAEHARQRNVEGLIVGLPLNMDGSFGPQAVKARALGRRVAEAAGLPLQFWDERLSSFIAESRLTTVSPRRGRRSDDVAAAVILQSYIDATAGQTAGATGVGDQPMDEVE